MIYQCRSIRTKTEPYFAYNNRIYYPSPESTSKSVLNSLSVSDIRSSYVINKYSDTFGTDSSLNFKYPYSPTIKLNKGFV